MSNHILIIGSGLAGSLLCNELAKDHQVTMLEKGPQQGITYPQFHFTHKKLAQVHTCCYGSGIDHPMGFVGKVKVKSEYSTDLKKLSAWDRGIMSAAAPFA